MPIDVHSLVREVDRLKARKTALETELQDIPRKLRALNGMIALYDNDAEPLSDGSEPTRHRHHWLVMPDRCLLPKTLHRAKTQPPCSGAGLCSNHRRKYLAGKMTVEELAVYKREAKKYMERNGFEVEL